MIIAVVMTMPERFSLEGGTTRDFLVLVIYSSYVCFLQ